MIVVQLNHHDGSVSETLVWAHAKLQDLSLTFSVDSVEILGFQPLSPVKP